MGWKFCKCVISLLRIGEWELKLSRKKTRFWIKAFFFLVWISQGGIHSGLYSVSNVLKRSLKFHIWCGNKTVSLGLVINCKRENHWVYKPFFIYESIIRYWYNIKRTKYKEQTLKFCALVTRHWHYKHSKQLFWSWTNSNKKHNLTTSLYLQCSVENKTYSNELSWS